VDGQSAVSYTYDVLDRVLTETQGHIPGGAVLTSTFARLDNLRDALAVTLDGTADLVNYYTYDERLRTAEITQTGLSGGNSVADKRVNFTYADDGRLENISRHANLTGTQLVAQTGYTYDNQNRLTGLSHYQGSTILADYDYTIDSVGRITGIVNSQGTIAYTYDDRGQLTAANYDYAVSSPADEAFIWDANGNIDDTSALVGDHNRPESDGTFEYTYDAEGNRTTRTHLVTGHVTEYFWDNRNRLVEVIDRDDEENVLQTVEFAYDFQNRWIGRTRDADGAGSGVAATTHFVQDGTNILIATDSDGDVTNRYLWGVAVDQALADEQRNPETAALDHVYWLLGDHLGTPRDIAEYNAGTGTTSIVSHREYSAFGRQLSETNPAVNQLIGFTGRPYDEAIGATNHLHRWLDSWLKQWLSEDPIGFSAGDANTRRVVNNDPINRVDPSGLREMLEYRAGRVTFHPKKSNGAGYGRGIEIGRYEEAADWTNPITGTRSTSPVVGTNVTLHEEYGGRVYTQHAWHDYDSEGKDVSALETALKAFGQDLPLLLGPDLKPDDLTQSEYALYLSWYLRNGGRTGFMDWMSRQPIQSEIRATGAQAQINAIERHVKANRERGVSDAYTAVELFMLPGGANPNPLNFDNVVGMMGVGKAVTPKLQLQAYPKNAYKWSNPSLQQAVDQIHYAQFKGAPYGKKVPITISVETSGQVTLSQVRTKPGARAIEEAKTVFGEANVRVVTGTTKANAPGEAGFHSEARGIQSVGPRAPGTKQASTHYSCTKCEARQDKEGIINITGNQSQTGTIVRPDGPHH
jgi:RHS repeat-associated protein